MEGGQGDLLQYHAKTLADNGLKSFLNRCFITKIEKVDVNRDKKNIVMITRDNYDFRKLITHIDDFTDAQAIYSMWEGSLNDSDLVERLSKKGMSLDLVIPPDTRPKLT